MKLAYDTGYSNIYLEIDGQLQPLHSVLLYIVSLQSWIILQFNLCSVLD